MRELEFYHKHGKNTTDRMVPELLEAIMACLETNGIQLEGKQMEIKRLGEGVAWQEDDWRLLFDVLNPDETFDYVEFKVTKTGWGRSFMPEASKEG